MVTATTATITARIPETAAAALTALSRTSGQTIGAIVRAAIEEYLLRIDPEELLRDLKLARQQQEEEQHRLEELTAEFVKESRSTSTRSTDEPPENTKEDRPSAPLTSP